MSASFDKSDGFSFYPVGEVTEQDRTINMMIFDQKFDYDLGVYKSEQKEIKLLKKICLIKTLLFPLELTFSFLFLGSRWTKIKVINSQKLYWRFLRKKISYEKFKKQLVNQIQENENLI